MPAGAPLPDFGLLPVGPDLIESYNPATGEMLGIVAGCSEEDYARLADDAGTGL